MSAGREIILGNTFHLMLRPGTAVIGAHGALHGFMHWDGPILTDSGGFQVFSLGAAAQDQRGGRAFAFAHRRRQGAFTSRRVHGRAARAGCGYRDVFDDCTAWPASEGQARESMERSMRWAGRCRRAHSTATNPAASCSASSRVACTCRLRAASLARAACASTFPACAMGGLAVGEPEEVRLAVLEEHHAADAGRPAALSDGRGAAGGPLAAVARGWTCSTA